MVYGDTVLVTGASSGVGKSIAQMLMENGYKVYGTTRKPVEPGSQITYGKKNKKGFIEMVALDVRSEDSVKKAVEYIVKKEGKIDVLINNAGIGIAGAVEDTATEEAYEQFDTNFFGVLRVCRSVIPIMRMSRNGLIINISSVAGLISIPFQSMYSASKYALEAISEALRIELKPFGINVVLVEPGDMKTGFTWNRKIVKAANNDSAYKEQFAKSLNTMIKDEMSGPPPDIVANTVMKLLRIKKPPVRVVVGIKYKIIVFLKRILPARFVEYVVSSIY
ncbi:MAG: SDR family oxidoreductase [Clostridiaceae bacterium]|nr:SDR family oxidoreductase [Clostridiaceae bacterium]